jgi:flagellar FliL protein
LDWDPEGAMARESERAEDTAAKARGGGISLFAVLGLVLGLAVGGAAGVLVAGPLVVRRIAEPAAPAGSVEGEKRGRREGVDTVPGAVHTLDNLIVNPAGTQGTRFLVVSVALEVDRPETAAGLVARDAEVRDAVLRVLGGKTVADLSDVEKRETLKDEIGAAVKALMKSGEIRRLYLPQFVIQ